ncbi:MAG: hypothetical protein ACLQVI_41125 [Polyangiaceae bacterium]
MKPLLLALVRIAVATLVVGCAGVDLSQAKSPSSSSSGSNGKASLDPTAPECPESKVPCVGADRECALDTTKDCMVCHCASPFGAAPDVGGVPPVQ